MPCAAWALVREDTSHDASRRRPPGFSTSVCDARPRPRASDRAEPPHRSGLDRVVSSFPQGLEFDLFVATAPEVVARNEYGGSAIEFDRRGSNDEDLFELGVSTAGQETSNASKATWPGRRMEPTELLLRPQSGGGGDAGNGGYWRMTWWLTPLPTTGQVEFWCRWKSGEIPRSAAVIDATRFTRAADSASPLWTGSPPG